MEKFLEDEELTVEEMKKALRAATIANDLVPVCCGTAYRNKGVQKLLDAIVDYMPSPVDIPPIDGVDPETGEETVRHSSDTEPFLSLIHISRRATLLTTRKTIPSARMTRLNSKRRAAEWTSHSTTATWMMIFNGGVAIGI